MKENPERLAQIRQAIDQAKEHSTSERSLIARLKAEHIDAVFRRTEDGRVYGATFVDHGSRTVLNGSALGKEYTARTWNEWFKTRMTEAERANIPSLSYEPLPLPGPSEPVVSLPAHDGAPSLIGQTLLEGLDVFGTLAEPEFESREYIDPEFRLMQYKKQKKKKRQRSI